MLLASPRVPTPCRKLQLLAVPVLKSVPMAAMIAPTRVLVQGVPAMLRDIVHKVIASQPDMMLLRDTPPGRVQHWRRPDPDVVIVATENIKDESGLAEWLNRWPRARLLVIEASGRETVMYELRPHAIPRGAVSPEELAAMIRQSVED